MAWIRKMGVDSVDYHRATVLGRSDDHAGRALGYYASRGETPLQWGGQLAARLGLVGAVDDASYEALFGPGGARDPHLGARLVTTKRPGMELVVSAHKSVAILGIIGRAEDMHAILDAETDATLGLLEEWFCRQGGRRGKAQRRVATPGLVWARTRHATSRSGDPCPHDHVLVANVAEMLDDAGGWKGLDTAALRDLTHAATMAGRLASAAVAVAVERGYAIEADRGPSGKLDHWAIAGIPKVVTEAFSKRSSEIDEAMESSGFTSYRARGIAARATRAAKVDESSDSLLVRWLNELDALGWPSRKIHERLRLVNEHRRRPLRRLSTSERAEMVRGLLAGPLAEHKVFTRTDVARVAAPFLYGATPEELNAVVAGVLAHPEAVALVGTLGARNRAYVAASVLAAEAAVEDVAARLAGADDRASLRRATLEAAVAAKEETLGRPLTIGQRRAVAVICGSGRGLDVVVGVAGSGKTTALEVVRCAFEADGYRVLGTAVSGQAARALATEAGVDSRTVASLVWRLEHGSLTLDANTLLLIDEAGMANDAQLLKLLVAVEAAGAKAVVIGDHHQLGAVGPGGGLEALVARHHPAVAVLDQNVRQRDPAERATLEQLRAGNVAKAVAWYRDNGRIVAAPERTDALDAAVDAWDADRRAGHDMALLAWRRRDVAALNERARRRCVAAGMVAGPEVEGPGGRRYATGDPVVFLAPGDGRWVTSERAVVVGVGDGHLTVVFDNGRREVLAGVDLDTDRLDYAYALTVHRTQAATVDRAHVLADGGGRELAYVAMSRARGTSHVYVVADDVDQAAEDLGAEWRRAARQRWVLDTDQVAGDDGHRRPDLARRTDATVRLARLRAERDAVAAVTRGADARLRVIDANLRLEQLSEPKPPARARTRR